VAIVGDIDFNEVKAIATKYFSSIPPSKKLPKILTSEPRQKGERRVEVDFDAKPQMAIGYHTSAAGDEDQPALDIISSILTRGRTSRLYKKMVEDEKIAQSVWASSPFSRYPDLFAIWITPKGNATVTENEKAAYEELEKLKTMPVTDWELQRVRNQLDADYIRGMSSNMGMAFRLTNYAALTGGWQFVKTHYDLRKAVTKEDIMRVANKYFKSDNRTVAYLVKPETAVKADNQTSGKAK
jgi:predicted Zn-dependent peptidase